MPTPEIMSMKMTADHKYRLPPVAGGGRAAAWVGWLARRCYPRSGRRTFGLTSRVLTIIERQMILSAVEAGPDVDLSGQQSPARLDDALVYYGFVDGVYDGDAANCINAQRRFAWAKSAWLRAFAAPACAGVASHPPAGLATLTASVGLGFWRGRSGCELCRRERLGIEPLCDIVAFAHRVRIALGRGEAEPFEGFGEVLFDADAACIEDAEVGIGLSATPRSAALRNHCDAFP